VKFCNFCFNKNFKKERKKERKKKGKMLYNIIYNRLMCARALLLIQKSQLVQGEPPLLQGEEGLVF
jgi:hypothetical protein